MEKAKKGRCPPRGASRRKHRAAYPWEFRQKAARLYLEEGLPPKLICRELGIHESVLYAWVRLFREGGEAGLKPRARGGGSGRRPSCEILRQKIADVKGQHPSFGVKRISQWLKRVLFLQASPETVRRTLHQQGLMPKSKKKTPRSPPKPRFSERSTPNQLLQSDIFTFRLGGKNAYLIGFVDDYSRYVVGLNLYRSQTAEHVLEVYRTAVAEYGVPKNSVTTPV
jgi:transposase-like protein